MQDGAVLRDNGIPELQIAGNGGRLLTITGIAVARRRVLSHLASGRSSA
jgi:hypothetical protein